MDIVTLNKGIRLAKMIENIEKHKKFLERINNQDPKSRGISFITLSDGGSSDVINYQLPITGGLNDTSVSENLKPAVDMIRQSIDAALVVLEKGINKAYKHLENEFINLKLEENAEIK